MQSQHKIKSLFTITMTMKDIVIQVSYAGAKIMELSAMFPKYCSLSYILEYLDDNRIRARAYFTV